MPTLKPFRQYEENEVLNFFALNGLANRGTVVKISNFGFTPTGDVNTILGSAGQGYANTVSPQWGVGPRVSAVSNTGDLAIGVTLFDVKAVDENGESLVWNSQKAVELQAVTSGQAVPILTRGVICYSGLAQPCTGGTFAYFDASANITTVGPENAKIGVFLGNALVDGFAFVRIRL